MSNFEDMLALPRDHKDPVFDQPWQAQAFSILVALNQAGHFTWKHWVEVFSRVIRSAPAMPGETSNDAYYRQWAAALEEIVISLGAVDKEEIAQREEQRRRAYLNTPHGEPVHLMNATCQPNRSIVTATRGRPITISQAQID